MKNERFEVKWIGGGGGDAKEHMLNNGLNLMIYFSPFSFISVWISTAR